MFCRATCPENGSCQPRWRGLPIILPGRRLVLQQAGVAIGRGAYNGFVSALGPELAWA